MVWSIGDPGDQSPWSLESWSKGTVMLLPITFAMPMFKTCNFGEIGDHGDQFLISKFWRGCGVYLGLCYVWDLFYGYQCILWWP